jgi:ribose 5-phosphate isomerase A
MSVAYKRAAAAAAMRYVKPGQKLGIGSGSTAEEFIGLLGEAVANGLQITGVATSERTAGLCQELAIPLSNLDQVARLDLTIDGADEIGPGLSLIKGGGAALLREKIVAGASDQMIVIADDSKLVEFLGAYPLPIEINRFGYRATVEAIGAQAGRLGLGGPVRLRETGGQPLVTDGGHWLVDASFGRIVDPWALSAALLDIPGVVQHGLFLGMAKLAIVAGEKGIRFLKP